MAKDRVRVSKKIDQGVDFSKAEHTHWLQDNDGVDIIWMIIMLIMPPFIIFLSY